MSNLKVSFMFLSLILFLSLVNSVKAQTATAKYNSAGDLIQATNLLSDATGCEAPKIFAGKIVSVESSESRNVVGFEFALRLANGKQQKFQASISLDEGAFLVDFENLLQKNRRVSVKARQCGNGGFWTAEKIMRL